MLHLNSGSVCRVTTDKEDLVLKLKIDIPKDALYITVKKFPHIEGNDYCVRCIEKGHVHHIFDPGAKCIYEVHTEQNLTETDSERVFCDGCKRQVWPLPKDRKKGYRNTRVGP